MYLVFKLIHVAAVIAFLGNITTGLFWHRHAARTRDPRLLAFTMDGIIRSDRIFTIPGVIVITTAGLFGAINGNLPLIRTEWIFWTIILFSISGIAFMSRVAPLQRKLHAMAAAGAAGGAGGAGGGAAFDYAAYHAVARQWEAWGAVALIAPLIGMALMILKPTL